MVGEYQLSYSYPTGDSIEVLVRGRHWSVSTIDSV